MKSSGMSAAQPRISIVLAFLNGARFLPDQLASLEAQDFTNWHLIACDDGSTDHSAKLITNAIPATQRSMHIGPQVGFAQNFLAGLAHVPEGQFAAFCDQDDVWYSHKLSRALKHLETQQGPALYYASRDVVCVNLKAARPQASRQYRGFAHALFRNFASGHTTVLNPAAVALLQRHLPSQAVPFHDWWGALLIGGAGGAIIRDPHPVLAYRQHGGNVLGATGGRIHTLKDGRYRSWVHSNCRALYAHRAALDPANQDMLETLHASITCTHWRVRARMFRAHPLSALTWS